MTPWITITIFAVYFILLIVVSRLTASKDNASFFLGNRQSRWWAVAIGMVGASVSGISVVSVPGMVIHSGFSYMQTVLGFFFGYVAIAYVLLPLYYQLNLTTIYGYLNQRFGTTTHKTGSGFFIVAKMVSAATKLYVVVLVLQRFALDALHVPFGATTLVCVLLIWLYTHRGGIKTIVWTDLLQTVFMIAAIVCMLVEMYHLLGGSFLQSTTEVCRSELSDWFIWNDWRSPRHFTKQFISGIFIVIVMTGLDQDMMQKNLSCRNLKEAQRNVISYGMAFVPVNLLLLMLGALMIIYTQRNGITLPEHPDEMVPMFATTIFGKVASLCFLLGIIAASFSSADSALTAITTTFAVDILNIQQYDKAKSEKYRKLIHAGVCLLFVWVVQIFHLIDNKSIIDLIYTIVGYAYGPLLGLFACGLLTKIKINERYVTAVAILAPLLTFVIQYVTKQLWNYSFGYELLLLNALITTIGLFFIRQKQTIQ
ncbi:MAG: sodium:solute symporter [Bacteroidales bacterium]|nr:sodium:solute symporter [Bacteroidales bacterium]